MATSTRTLSTSVLDEKDDEKKKKKGQSKSGGAAGGAASGASVGAAGGPIGSLIGAGLGAAAGAAEANQADKATGPRPKRRRLSKGIEKFEEVKGKRERAMATLSQAVFDFAANLR